MEYQVLYTRVSTLAEDALTFTAGYASVTAAAPLAVALPRVPTTNVPLTTICSRPQHSSLVSTLATRPDRTRHPAGVRPTICVETLCTLPFCDIEQSRVISGCSGMPWAWFVPRHPLGSLPGPCGASGSADARDRVQIWRNFKI